MGGGGGRFTLATGDSWIHSFTDTVVSVGQLAVTVRVNTDTHSRGARGSDEDTVVLSNHAAAF